MLYHQITGFGNCLEVFVVIGVASATILHTVAVIVVVAHFVKESSVNLRGIPFAGTVGADALIAQVFTDQGKLLLYSSGT
jgi:hypothetical protein